MATLLFVMDFFSFFLASRDFVNDDAAIGKGNKASFIDVWNKILNLISNEFSSQIITY